MYRDIDLVFTGVPTLIPVDKIIFSKKEARQFIVAKAIGLKSQRSIEFGCSLQITDGQVGPYLFGIHDVVI